MSHHGEGPFDGEDGPDKFKKVTDRAKLLRDLMDTTGFRGALGDFPEGTLTKTDEGAIQFAIGVERGKVVLDFGKQVQWVGMNPQQAADLASVLLKRAREAARINGETVGFTIG